MHGGRYCFWTPALARHWSVFPPPQHALSWSPQRAYQMQAWLTVGCGGWVRPARTGGSRALACMWPGPARTAHLIASVLGRILCASSLHLFDWPGRCEPSWSVPHCSHYIFCSASAHVSHSGGWWPGQTSFCSPMFMVHSLHMSQVMLE